eukprot:TRINITY_DN169_c0_g3_i1.p1 TRINITY_DN169_c0_g3~~TRINITY_DN169_c0_g3_i1.p1  ORF type:complete len:536 (-),score=113.14 TRINITY_DN169_c0_g3_i1:37-1644(-)
MLSRSSRSLLSVLVLVVAIGSAACVPIDIAPHIDSTLRLRHSCTNDNALQPFVSVTVVMGTSSNVECPAGYIKNPQDLNQGAGGQYIYLCTSTGEAGFGQPLTDLTAVAASTSSVQCPAGYTRIERDLNTGARGSYIYWCYQRGGVQALTNVAFVVNTDVCPANHELIRQDLNQGTSGPSIFACKQRSCSVKFEALPELRFRPTGGFRVVQFSDIHTGEPAQDFNTQNVMRRILQDEKPDLVILNGDQVSDYSWNRITRPWFQGFYERLLDPILAGGYRYAFAMGNHDPGADLNAEQIITVDQQAGGILSLTKRGPTYINGTTNYVINVMSSKGAAEVTGHVWVLDSGVSNCEGVRGYGCVERDQIAWYKETATQLRQMNPGNRVNPALAYFHIPMQEHMEVNTVDDCVGRKEENSCCFSVNTGLFDAFKLQGDVRAITVGHDHNIDFVANLEGIYVAYGRKSGYGGYGPPRGWLLGSRVIELFEDGSIQTWIRQQDGSKLVQVEKCNFGSQDICCGAGLEDCERCDAGNETPAA